MILTKLAAKVSVWGNSLALRLTKRARKTAGVTEGSPERIMAEPGRNVIETEMEPRLDQLLAGFDPKRHGGEAMADRPAGQEAFGNQNK